jgi:hypothetical protein
MTMKSSIVNIGRVAASYDHTLNGAENFQHGISVGLLLL